MQLTTFSTLGLQVMIHLHKKDLQERVTSGDISKEIEASATHVAKVVTKLAELGLVHSRRGRGGGLTLTSVGRNASLGQVLRKLEGPVQVDSISGPCMTKGCCDLRDALNRAEDAFLTSLDGVKIAELAASNRRNRRRPRARRKK